MNIQLDPTSSNLASAMLNSKIRPRAVVGYGVKIFHPSPPNYVTRSPGLLNRHTATWNLIVKCLTFPPTAPQFPNEQNPSTHLYTAKWTASRRLWFFIGRVWVLCLILPETPLEEMDNYVIHQKLVLRVSSGVPNTKHEFLIWLLKVFTLL